MKECISSLASYCFIILAMDILLSLLCCGCLLATDFQDQQSSHFLVPFDAHSSICCWNTTHYKNLVVCVCNQRLFLKCILQVLPINVKNTIIQLTASSAYHKIVIQSSWISLFIQYFVTILSLTFFSKLIWSWKDLLHFTKHYLLPKLIISWKCDMF